MEQRKEQKKGQRVYAAFGRGARRDWKRAARKTVFSHYWMAIMVCLVAAFLGTEFTGSLESLHFTRQKWDVISNFLASFGRPGAAANSRGVFAIAVNKIADGSLQNIVNNTIMSLAGSSEFWQSFGIVVSSLVSMTYWVLVTHTFVVILRRLFMEMRVYEEVPPYRALYLHSARCWGRTSLALLRVAVQRGLWWLTIVGGAIKTFSYYLCGFILAENPTMKGGDAIALSRKMMNGHKWECFLLELSFVPWHLLSLATFGLSSLFYSSAYLSAARCEFYAAVRAQVKAEGEAQALRDTYLFEKASAKTLRRAYNDLGKPAEKLPERVYGNRVTRFFGECLGVTLFVNPQDVAREKIQDREYRLRYMRRCEQGLSYPIRLSPLLQYEHKDHEPALFTRKYPVTTLVLLTLYKLRDKPWLEFWATVVVCGVVEYFTAYYLETVYDRRWWDYAGYFLNLHGRICAEGLLVFGLGGMAIVYGVAPLFDNLLHKVRHSVLIGLCAALIALFCVDQAYSHFHPNEGEGITDEVVYKTDDARIRLDEEAFV